MAASRMLVHERGHIVDEARNKDKWAFETLLLDWTVDTLSARWKMDGT